LVLAGKAHKVDLIQLSAVWVSDIL